MAYTAYEKINMTLRTNCIKICTKCLCYSITIGQYRHFTVKEPKTICKLNVWTKFFSDAPQNKKK